MAGNDSDIFWDKHKPENDETKDKQPMLGPFNRGQLRFSLWYLVGGIIFLMLINSIYTGPRDTVIQYNEFKDRVENGEIVVVEIHEQFLRGLPQVPDQAPALEEETASSAVLPPSIAIYRTARVDDPGLVALLDESNVDYYAVPTRDTPILNMLLGWVLPFALLLVVWRVMFKRMGGLGQNVMSFGKNNAQIVAEGETGVRFADVAGVDEAKAELEEVVDFLERPQRYTAIGGKIPKGVLLVGPPGTGKTMLAKAVAGEAGVPFFRMSGADFVEMFVGVGAARVRDLFRQAREKAPCIIFIDELDAIGKSRVQAVSSNDEREQTLNQLLVEMDGFDSRTGVIILGATNRPEILDPALLRPGRFDRQVVVDKPDVAGREAILRIHVRGVTLADDVDLAKVARSTPGLVGADLANIVNEAALLAVRAGREAVSQEDLMRAIEKTIGGLEKKNKLINPREREIVAYHETGHALVAHLTPGADPVEKITIVPRGIGALGYTLQLPTEERYLLTEDELLGKIDVLLGGRAAEQVIFGKISTGAANDINRASDMVRKMITEYGMSERFTNVYLPSTRNPSFLQPGDGGMREYSEATQTYIDEETARIIGERYQAVVTLLESRRDALERVAKELLDKETLERTVFVSLLGESDPSQ